MKTMCHSPAKTVFLQNGGTVSPRVARMMGVVSSLEYNGRRHFLFAHWKQLDFQGNAVKFFYRKCEIVKVRLGSFTLKRYLLMAISTW